MQNGININLSKEAAYISLGEKALLEIQHNEKLFYDTLKQLKTKKPSIIFKLLNIKNKQEIVLIEEKDIVERWKQHFEELLDINREDQEREITYNRYRKRRLQ